MPRLLTPYENTPNAAFLNKNGQITRRQFEMVVDPETPLTRRQARRMRWLLLFQGGSFVAWAALYAWDQGRIGADVPSEIVVYVGGALLVLNVLLLVALVLRWIYGVVAIPQTTEEIGSAVRKRIRDGNLNIHSMQGRLKFRHLARRSPLCSIAIGRREFAVSQALWEALQEQGVVRNWTVHYLKSPTALLSVMPTQQLALLDSGSSDDVVSGHTILGRSEVNLPDPRGDSR